jgi:hypothetical protein
MSEGKCPKYVVGIVLFFIISMLIIPEMFWGIIIFCILLYMSFKSDEDSKALKLTREELKKYEELNRQIFEAEEDLKKAIIKEMLTNRDNPKLVESCIEGLKEIDQERAKRKEEDKNIIIIDDKRCK